MAFRLGKKRIITSAPLVLPAAFTAYMRAKYEPCGKFSKGVPCVLALYVRLSLNVPGFVPEALKRYTMYDVGAPPLIGGVQSNLNPFGVTLLDLVFVIPGGCTFAVHRAVAVKLLFGIILPAFTGAPFWSNQPAKARQ
jgi:hypothetical protein